MESGDDSEERSRGCGRPEVIEGVIGDGAFERLAGLLFLKRW